MLTDYEIFRNSSDMETMRIEIDVKKLPKHLLEQMAVLSAQTGQSFPAVFTKALRRYLPKAKDKDDPELTKTLPAPLPGKAV